MEKPNYFAIMPASVRYDERLKPSEKILYAEITALINIKGYCYATNQYFSKLYGVHKNSISIWINNLIKCGYLKVKYVIREIEGQKRQERRIYVVKRKEIKKEIEDTNFCEGVSQKTVMVTENTEGPSQKNVRGYQSNLGDPLNEKTEENNISRIIKENNYYIYTYRGEENLPIVREILKKYSELGLPSYEYPPEKNLVMKAYGELGAKGVFKALEIMSKSNFVMEKMCVDTILKVENLKKALNGNFKADVEEKSVELVGKKRESIKKSGDEKKFEESEEGKQWKEEQKRKISELLEKDVEEEDTPELFSVEELFGKR